MRPPPNPTHLNITNETLILEDKFLEEIANATGLQHYPNQRRVFGMVNGYLAHVRTLNLMIRVSFRFPEKPIAEVDLVLKTIPRIAGRQFVDYGRDFIEWELPSSTRGLEEKLHQLAATTETSLIGFNGRCENCSKNAYDGITLIDNAPVLFCPECRDQLEIIVKTRNDLSKTRNDLIGDYKKVLEKHALKLAAKESDLPAAKNLIKEALEAEIEKQSDLLSLLVELDAFVPTENAWLVERYQGLLNQKKISELEAPDKERVERILQGIRSVQSDTITRIQKVPASKEYYEALLKRYPVLIGAWDAQFFLHRRHDENFGSLLSGCSVGIILSGYFLFVYSRYAYLDLLFSGRFWIFMILVPLMFSIISETITRVREKSILGSSSRFWEVLLCIAIMTISFQFFVDPGLHPRNAPPDKTHNIFTDLTFSIVTTFWIAYASSRLITLFEKNLKTISATIHKRKHLNFS